MSEAPLLEVRDLRKTFWSKSPSGRWDEFVAIDSINLQIARGSALAVVGESGSGKTTTARIIAGLERATSGEIKFAGEPWIMPRGTSQRRVHARRVQMVFQDPFGSLDPRQTLGASLDEVLRLHDRSLSRKQRADRVEEVFDLVGLDAQQIGKRPRALSGGQRQRFAIGRALALLPELLILDEAVSALDVSVQAQILNLLIDLRSRIGVSYLFVSHDLAVVRQVSDHIVVMHAGAIVESGRTDAVLDLPVSPYAQQLLAAIPRPAWEA